MFTSWSLITGLTKRAIGWPDPGSYEVLGLCGLLVVAAVTITVRVAAVLTSNANTRYE